MIYLVLKFYVLYVVFFVFMYVKELVDEDFIYIIIVYQLILFFVLDVQIEV